MLHLFGQVLRANFLVVLISLLLVESKRERVCRDFRAHMDGHATFFSPVSVTNTLLNLFVICQLHHLSVVL